MMLPIRERASDPKPEGTRLLSAEAAFITVDMLSHNPRPGEDNRLIRRDRWPIAWKTGTSWGFRTLVGGDCRAVRAGGLDRRFRCER